MSRDAPRLLLKAMFSRTPMLSSLLLNGSIELCLRGLLDAGVAALPSLSSVGFVKVRPADCSVGIVPDPLEPIFRRFVHRFPRVQVRIKFNDNAWEDSEQLRVVQLRYVCWPSVEMYWPNTGRIRGPPMAHPSDDDIDSEVDELEDPLAAEEH